MSTRRQPSLPDKLPGATCPKFDEAIASIEIARKANAEMRSIAEGWQEQSEYWESRCEDLHQELQDANEESDRFRDRITELEREVRSLENQIPSSP